MNVCAEHKLSDLDECVYAFVRMHVQATDIRKERIVNEHISVYQQW